MNADEVIYDLSQLPQQQEMGFNSTLLMEVTDSFGAVPPQSFMNHFYRQ